MSTANIRMLSREYRGVSCENEKEKVSGKSIAVISLLFLFSAGLYLFSINKNAVHGYQVRSLEREIAELEKEQGALRIQEADVRSLERTKEAGARMGMERSNEVVVIERPGSVALAR